MSYSRWNDSYWYTFWCVQDSKTENRDTCIFEICGLTYFTAKELRKDLDKCMNIVRKKDPDVVENQIIELKTYIKRFLNNVDGAYPLNSEK